MAVLGKRRGEQALTGQAQCRIGFEAGAPSAIAITTRASFDLGAQATDTVIVSKCGNGQESSLYPSGT
jgi:hypothetical protein